MLWQQFRGYDLTPRPGAGKLPRHWHLVELFRLKDGGRDNRHGMIEVQRADSPPKDNVRSLARRRFYGLNLVQRNVHLVPTGRSKPSTYYSIYQRPGDSCASCQGENIENEFRITSTFASYAELAEIPDFVVKHCMYSEPRSHRLCLCPLQWKHHVTGQLQPFLDINGLKRDECWRSNIRPQAG